MLRKLQKSEIFYNNDSNYINLKKRRVVLLDLAINT